MTNLNKDLGLTEGEVIDSYLQEASGDIEIEPGTYEWHGEGLDTEDGDIVGLGDKGDVVFEHTDGSRMTYCYDGDKIQNIVIYGTSHESKSGCYVYPGSTHDGVLILDGADDIEGRGFYDGEGSATESTITNCLCSGTVNNGAYLDKHPKTVKNSVFLNNNIANLRVGHFEERGTPDAANQTTYVRNCLIGLTEDVRPNMEAGGAQNARGLRIRHQGQFVIENCWFVYKPAAGATYAFSVNDGVDGPVDVTFRNCHWHNDSSAYPILDKTEGDANITLENCTFSGTGDDSVHADADGSLEHVDTKTVPYPSQFTGYPQADDAWGFNRDIEPFGEVDGYGDVDYGEGDYGGDDGSNDDGSDDSTTETYEHTLKFTASSDNPTGDAVEGDFDATFTVDGPVSVPNSAEIFDNDDGTKTVKVNNLQAGESRTYEYDGAMYSYVVDDGYSYTVSYNGVETTYDDIINGTVEDGSDGSEDGSDGNDDDADDSSTDEHTTFTDIEDDVRAAAAEEAQDVLKVHNEDNQHLTEEEVRVVVSELVREHEKEKPHHSKSKIQDVARRAVEKVRFFYPWS